MQSDAPRRMRFGSEQRGLGLALPTGLFLLIFFMLPLILMFMMSILSRGDRPADYELPLTTTNYTEIFREPTVTVFARSVRIALITTVLCFALGYPLAFFISTRRRAWARNMALFFVILPFWTNFLVRTYAWQIILGRRGVLNEFIFWIERETGLKILDRPLEILGTEGAVLLGLVYSFLPFMVLPIYASVERFNFRLVEAGHDLGANDWRVFRRVVFPLTLPGVVAGWILVFIPAIGAFVTPALLGGTRGFMIGNFINRQFKEAGGSWPLGSGSSMVIMFLVSISLFIYLRYADDASYQRQQGLLERWFSNLGRLILWPLTQLSELVGRIFSPMRENVQHDFSSRAVKRQIVFDLMLRRIGNWGMVLNMLVCYIFLWIPIILLVTYSFNASRRAGGRWEGFTLDWYDRIFAGVSGTGGSQFSTSQMLQSVETSVIVSISATLIAVVLGTTVSLALARGKFMGKQWLNGMLYLPIVIPDITMGVSLLVFFKVIFDFIESIGFNRPFPGMWTVIIGHVAFNISFVAIVVRARLADMNPRLEEAARDLGANEWRTFWRVTYPLLLPGIVAGALLAFTLSLDDFVITFFVGGGTITTLTVFVWGLVRRGVSPEINAVSALMILVSMVLIGLSLLLQNRSAKAR